MLRLYIIVFVVTLNSCVKRKNLDNQLIGTWSMVYAEVNENDSIKIKDLSSSNFIKSINKSHFFFFNQDSIADSSYGGAGTYTLDGNTYIETLAFTSNEAIKDHQFSFNVEIKGDTLIQTGLEVVKKAGINREIIEKYIRIN